ncbi:MAG: DNA polymerase Y family protein, partial [Paracoccaceae bacterium]
AMKMNDVDAGFGIDMLRLEACVNEPLHAHQHKGHLDAACKASSQLASDTVIDDLIGRIGARIGLDNITRQHPADSHIPEKTSKLLAAAWSGPACDWPKPTTLRPLILWRPEPVSADQTTALPLMFRWRRRRLNTLRATGPERIGPEWWLDEADWRTGVRDYWLVTTERGERLWLYYAHGGAMSPGWFCHGSFA